MSLKTSLLKIISFPLGSIAGFLDERQNKELLT